MLANASSLYALAIDITYPKRYEATLQLQQDFGWRTSYGVLKGNILFLYSKQNDDQPPYLLLAIEDCYIELCDENKIGKDFTFEIKLKRTGRSFILAADNFKSLERWVSILTISPIQYITISKQSFSQQIELSQSTAKNN